LNEFLTYKINKRRNFIGMLFKHIYIFIYYNSYPITKFNKKHIFIHKLSNNSCKWGVKYNLVVKKKKK
jgi:uncharacterized membrane protein YesL